MDNTSPKNLLVEYMMKYDMSDSENLLKYYNEVSAVLKYHPILSYYGEEFEMAISVSVDGTRVEVIPHNLITALSMCEIYPNNYRKVISDNEYITKDKIYTFREEDNKLIIKNI